jgi:pyrroloquinoline-quinone synthase
MTTTPAATLAASEAVLQELDALIGRRSILNHPFYQAWNAGTLTSEQLRTYAASYYPHVAAFPEYLGAAAFGTNDAVVRAEILDNLREELAEPVPHTELWLRFAAGVGADRAAIAAAPATASTRATIQVFQKLCGDSTARGLAALYAYESQQPEVSRSKAAGLCDRYQLADERTLSYFTVHAEADLRHRAGERTALGRCLEQGATREEVLDAATRALDAYWGLLDGVCAEAGVPMAC